MMWANLRARIARKLKKVTTRVRRGGRKWAARAYYSLPGCAKRDPRRRIVRCAEECDLVTEFREGDSQAIGDWRLPIWRRETIRRQAAICLDEKDASSFQNGALKYQNGERAELPEVSLSCFQGCTLVGKDFLVLPKKEKILLESALREDEILELSGIFDRIQTPKRKELKGSYALIAHPWAWGFYHWMLEVLPKLSIVEQFPELSEVRLIVPHDRKKFQIESLLEAGISSDRLVVLDDGDWDVDRLYFPDMPGPSGTPSPHAVEWLRRTFLGSPEPDSSFKAHRKFYLSRQDAPQRRVRNEGEIIGFLKTKGFEIVQAGALSFREQVALFAEASVIVAPHGAALTNLVFAPQSCTVIEMFGDNYINGCYWALANVRGQKYGCVIAPTDTLDYTIPVGRLKSLMDRMLDSICMEEVSTK